MGAEGNGNLLKYLGEGNDEGRNRGLDEKSHEDNNVEERKDNASLDDGEGEQMQFVKPSSILSKDWGASVDVVGYCFLNLGSKYQPQEEFDDWIKKGPKPIYIGFGSMLLNDPRNTTKVILEALESTGQRGILNRGWGDLGVFSEVPDNIFLLEDCPHDWLFPQCSAVVHHGGAGTTASGLKAGICFKTAPFLSNNNKKSAKKKNHSQSRPYSAPSDFSYIVYVTQDSITNVEHCAQQL